MKGTSEAWIGAANLNWSRDISIKISDRPLYDETQRKRTYLNNEF